MRHVDYDTKLDKLVMTSQTRMNFIVMTSRKSKYDIKWFKYVQFEFLEPLDSALPAGLLASPALVQLLQGTAYIPSVNVGFTNVLLYSRTIVGTLDGVNVVSLPTGVV